MNRGSPKPHICGVQVSIDPNRAIPEGRSQKIPIGADSDGYVNLVDDLHASGNSSDGFLCELLVVETSHLSA